MRIALEVEHGVDDVLEHARAGDRALLRHVADEQHDHAALLGESRQLRRAFAHLRDAAGRRRERFRVDGLDRVDDDDLRRRRVDRGDDRLELHFGQQLDRRVDESETLRAQRDLLGGFLAGDVQRPVRGAQRRTRLQQQRRLADAGIAAEQDRRRPARGRRRARDRIPRARSECATSRAPSTDASGVTVERAPVTLSKRAAPWRRPSRRACSTTPQCGHCPCHFGDWPPHSVHA